MIEAVLWGLLGGGGVALVFQAKLRRSKARSAAADLDVITVAVKGLAGKQRWRHGRVRTTAEHLTWQPWWRVGSVLPLPAELHPVGQRRPRAAEMWAMNPQVVIIECQSSAGDLSLGVMPWDVEQVQGLLHRRRAQ
ncbi:DUF2550 family protein [Streptomyces filamentosus]|uniref:DUF2550 family protein n=1 Tax=Streptomyces filamentosus TaxID=67294 RepID=UPI00123B21B1|nr:DUF2550 family protein [Streptomyces filamentosus]